MRDEGFGDEGSRDIGSGRMEAWHGRKIGFAEAVQMGFRRYFDFRGRSQRAEYWLFYLFTVIGSAGFEVMDGLLWGGSSYGPLASIFSLVTFIPVLSAGWRRMHDIDRSGWWYLCALLPLLLVGVGIGLLFDTESEAGDAMIILGLLLTLVSVVYTVALLAKDSDRGTNRFGPSPKYSLNATIFD